MIGPSPLEPGSNIVLVDGKNTFDQKRLSAKLHQRTGFSLKVHSTVAEVGWVPGVFVQTDQLIASPLENLS